MTIQRGRWRDPRWRTAEPRVERHATWSELFYDLVFVVLVARLAHRLGSHLDPAGVAEFLALFVAVWWAWIGEVYYSTRFDSDLDRGKRFLGMLQLIGLVLLAVAVEHGMAEASLLFGAAYAFVQVVQIGQVVRAGIWLPAARPFVRHFATGYALGVAVWLAALLLPPPGRYIGWAVGLTIELLTSVLAGDLHRRFPPHVTHIPERFGLFVILVLGESFVSIVAGLLRGPLDGPAVVLAALGVAIIVGVWWTYFDQRDDVALRALVGQGRSRPYLAWVYVHLPLTAALTTLGAGLGLVIAARDAAVPVPVTWLFAAGLTGYLLAAAVVTSTRVCVGPPHLTFTPGVRVRLLAAVLLFLGAMLMGGSTWGLLLLAAVLLWLIALTDYRLGPSVSEDRLSSSRD